MHRVLFNAAAWHCHIIRPWQHGCCMRHSNQGLEAVPSSKQRYVLKLCLSLRHAVAANNALCACETGWWPLYTGHMLGTELADAHAWKL
jgi:hypothetical protein